VAGEPGRDGGPTDGGREGFRVDPEFSVRAETEHAVAQDEDALASLVGHAECGTSDAECLVEIVQGRIGRAIRPELLHGLLALEPVAGRDRQHLHEFARLAQATFTAVACHALAHIGAASAHDVQFRPATWRGGVLVGLAGIALQLPAGL